MPITSPAEGTPRNTFKTLKIPSGSEDILGFSPLASLPLPFVPGVSQQFLVQCSSQQSSSGAS